MNRLSITAVWLIRGLLLLSLVTAPWPTACTASGAVPTEIPYLNRHEIRVPFDVPPASTSPTANRVVLYVSPDHGQHWQAVGTAPPSTDAFTFRTNLDGEYWFCRRAIDRAGQSWPPGPCTPELRMRVDTVTPVIDGLTGAMTDDGVLGVSWRAHDAFLDPDSLEVQIKTDLDDRWQTVRHSPNGVDSSGSLAGRTTVQLPTAARRVMLRAKVHDLAGNVAQSESEAIIRLPSPKLRKPAPPAVAADPGGPPTRADQSHPQEDAQSGTNSQTVSHDLEPSFADVRRLPPAPAHDVSFAANQIDRDRPDRWAQLQRGVVSPGHVPSLDLPIVTPSKKPVPLFRPPPAGDPRQESVSEDDEQYDQDEDDDDQDDDDEDDDDDKDVYEPILLRRGATMTEVGFIYRYRELNVPVVLSDSSLSNRQLRIRQAFMPITFWYGVTDQVSCYVDVPVRYLNEQEADPEFEDFHTRGGIGDVGVGLVTLLYDRLDCEEKRNFALWSIDVTTPTGGDPFGLSSGSDLIESGFWNFSTDVEFRRSVGDLTTFGSIGYVHYLPETYFGVEVLKGNGALYSAGIGWYIHDDYWVEAELQGFSSGNMDFDGVGAPTTSSNVVSAQFTVFSTTSGNTNIEPFLRAGLTEDADTVVFGVALGRSSEGGASYLPKVGAARYGNLP